MGTNGTTDLVEQHLQLMADAPVEDEATAQQALAYALSAVGGMNQHLTVAQQPRAALAGPVDDIVKKLEDWIKRLVAKLTEIAKQLKASFSITVGTSISVTISCGPFD
jgi:hypothetical protein